MLDNDFSELLPEENDKHNKQLLQDIHHLYNTRKTDEQSLAAIRSRLLARGLGPLPNPPCEEQPVMITHVSQKRQARQVQSATIYAAFQHAQPWQRLSALAAALFVALLVGSIVLLLTLSHTNNMASSPQLYAGWTQTAYLHGNSSQTFTKQSIRLSSLWGANYGCIGNGSAHIEIVDTGDQLATACKPNTPTILHQGPSGIYLAATDSVIHEIKVTVHGTLSWYLQFANASSGTGHTFATLTQPTSGWLTVSGMGSTGAGLDQISDPGTKGVAVGNKTIIPRIWAVLITCTGTGTLAVQLDAPTEVNSPKCDTTPHLQVLQYQKETNIHSMQVTTKGTITWLVQVFACIDEQHCLKNAPVL